MTDTPAATATATEAPGEARRWRVETDFPVLLEPVVADGILYAVESSAGLARPTGAPTDHSLLALSTADGTDRWRVGLGDEPGRPVDR